MDSNNTSTSICQSGKSGGDASGSAFASGMGASGDASGIGGGFSSGGAGGVSGIGYGESGAIGAVGGDVSDNTSIGSININS